MKYATSSMYPSTIAKRSIDRFAIIFVLIVYTLLIVPTMGRLGIGWDESTDLEISRSYLTERGFFFGSSRDPSQTRLPMFLAALVFRVTGTSSLLLARFISVVVGALTILGIYIYGKDRFGAPTGLLAAALLSINPFFLAFARLAFTESDIYLACTLIWLLVILSRIQSKPSIAYATLTGIFLGLSLASKATVVFILPAIFTWLLQYAHNTTAGNVNAQHGATKSCWSVSLLSVLAIGVALMGFMVSRQLHREEARSLVHLLNYGLVFMGWSFMLGWAIRFRNYSTHSLALFAHITAIGLFTFFIFPPEHLLNTTIIETLISRANDEVSFKIAFVQELAALHMFSILLKSTPVLGLGLLTSFAFSLAQWRRRELALPLLVVSFYLFGILILPLGQTFYTIPILPILSLLAADQLVPLYFKRRQIAAALISIGFIWWVAEMKLSYPDYHLNGYQWLGERGFFGRSSIGYRSIVYVPSDGVQQSIIWLNEHARSGETAQLYVEPWHIVRSFAPKPAYKISDGRDEGLDIDPDYVVIHMGATIRQGEGDDNPEGVIYLYPFDPDVLQTKYVQVFIVERAFGIEVASVWKRK